MKKKVEKIENYQDRRYKVKKMWHCQDVTVEPIIIGALGTISFGFDEWIRELPTKIEFAWNASESLFTRKNEDSETDAGYLW